MPKNSLYLQLVLARNGCMIYTDGWRKRGRRGTGLGGKTAQEIQMRIQTSIDAVLKAAAES